jgi:hypothetical protein
MFFFTLKMFFFTLKMFFLNSKTPHKIGLLATQHYNTKQEYIKTLYARVRARVREKFFKNFF